MEQLPQSVGCTEAPEINCQLTGPERAWQLAASDGCVTDPRLQQRGRNPVVDQPVPGGQPHSSTGSSTGSSTEQTASAETGAPTTRSGWPGADSRGSPACQFRTFVPTQQSAVSVPGAATRRPHAFSSAAAQVACAKDDGENPMETHGRECLRRTRRPRCTRTLRSRRRPSCAPASGRPGRLRTRARSA